MNKLEQTVITRFLKDQPVRISNTKVERVGNETHLFLHGNLIAKKMGTEIWGCMAGWGTPTTRSRLNAVARAVGGRGIYRKNWVWHLDDGTPLDVFTWYPIVTGPQWVKGVLTGTIQPVA